MNHKIKIIGIATIVGACVGAVLGFGPLQRYKSNGVLSMELGTSEYKRITELANDPTSIRQYLKVAPPPSLDVGKFDEIVNTVAKGDWHKALPKISKLDSKELPDVVLQMERESNNNNNNSNSNSNSNNEDKSSKRDSSVYFGLRISNTARQPNEAKDLAVWLGGYFKEVATREAVRELISNWAADNRQFSDKAREQQLKYKFAIEQAEVRSLAFKELLLKYPSANVNRQIIEVRKTNEKFLSPMAQLVAAESEIIEIKEKSLKLSRQLEQHRFSLPLIVQAEQELNQSGSGSESVNKLFILISEYNKKVKTDADKEKLLTLTSDLSNIAARFLSLAQFIALPTTPNYPERPTPLIYIVLVGLLFALVAALYCWRRELLSLLRSVSDLKPIDPIARS